MRHICLMFVMSSIQIGVACGNNCEKYVDFLIRSVSKTISGNYNVEFLLAINKPTVDEGFLSSLSYDNVNIVTYKDFNKSESSMGHGLTLDSILQKMSASYCMFIDCDVAFLKHGWDEVFIKLLHDDTVIVGAEYDGHKYMKFPNIVCCMFITEVIKKLDISFVPILVPTPWVTIDESNQDIYSRKSGDKMFLDAGWELCYKLKTAGYKGVELPLVRAGKNSVFMKYGMRGEEHQLDGVPIFTHVGRSLLRNFDKSLIVIRWRKEVDKWISQ